MGTSAGGNVYNGALGIGSHSYITQTGSNPTYIDIGGNMWGTNIRFDVRKSDGTILDNAVIINSDGNVGIGTTSPGSKLEVYNAGSSWIKVNSGATAPYKAGIELSRSSTNAAKIWNDGSAVHLNIDSLAAPDVSHPTYGGINFRTAPVTSGTMATAMRIDGYGNVGIGKDNPSEKLDVNGNAIIGGPNGALRITSTSNTLWLEGENGTRTGTIDKINFAGYNGNSNTMTVDLANGKVGIGTTTPSVKLEVAGAIKSSKTVLIGSANITTEVNGDVNVW